VWAKSFRVLRRGGKLVTLTLPIPDAPAGKLAFFSKTIGGVTAASFRALLSGKKFAAVRVEPRGGDLEKINALIEAGKLRPVIEKVFQLEEIAEAHRVSEGGHVRGKLVVKIG
jgi:alcohol dehydrogenase